MPPRYISLYRLDYYLERCMLFFSPMAYFSLVVFVA